MKSLTFLNKMMVPARASIVSHPLRAFATNAFDIKSKFEAAYHQKMDALSKFPEKV